MKPMSLNPPQPRDPLLPLALEGIRVLDMSRLIAGPYSAMLLADLGANVIKVEAPGRGDEARHLGMQDERTSGVFVGLNRNKRSIAIDLKTEAGRNVIRDLVKRSDVLVENFSSGVMDGFGLGYKHLSALHPKIIYCSVSGFGRTGRYAGRPGFDPVAQADSGLFSMNGYPDGPPVRTLAPIVDTSTGLVAWGSILAALYAREKTGKGQHVEVALFDVAVSLTGNYATNYLLTGEEQTRIGNDSKLSQPVGLFSARDADFYLSCSSDRLFQKLTQSIPGASRLISDPAYSTGPARLRNSDALRVKLNEIFEKFDCNDLVGRILSAGIPAGAVRSIGQALRSDEVADRGLLSAVEHPKVGLVPNIAPPFRLSETPPAYPRPFPLLDQDRISVLEDDLQYSHQMIASLTSAGAFGAARQ